MSVRLRSIVPAGVLLATAAVLGTSQAAWAHEAPPRHGEDHAPGEHRVGPLGPLGAGDPTAGPEYFTQHLSTYHFAHPLVGFDVAATSLPGWFNYHFAPTGQETAARVVAPSKAPDVEGDTWVPTAAPQFQGGSEHSTAHKKGVPLHLPVYPSAGPEYLGKWAQGEPSAEEAVPAVQETARRALVPTETSPAVKGDQRVDKRPGPDSPAPVAIAPPAVNDTLQQGWNSGPGTLADQALTPITGHSSPHGPETGTAANEQDQHAGRGAGPETHTSTAAEGTEPPDAPTSPLGGVLGH